MRSSTRRATCAPAGAGYKVYLQDGEIRYIQGNRNHPVNKGILCAKGSAGIMNFKSPARFGRVRKFEGPHTEDNYLLQEMGYQVARRHATKLRFYAQTFAFLIPAVLIGIASGPATVGTMAAGVVASVSTIFGLLIERWLVFAQARHVVTLYYGHNSD